MNLQVLVSTMYQNDYGLLDKMHIRSNAVIINQCDENRTIKFEYNGHRIVWINTDERGVGKSRNRAILASEADILLFADDDVVYSDNYVDTVVDFFENNTKCTFATFNLTSLNPERPEPIVKKNYRLRLYNCLKFGAFRIAVKREQLLANNIFYSLLYGGGAKYQAGEDNLFLTQCIQCGMRGMASSANIGTVAQEESTWFAGYNEKYYADRGALFSSLYGRAAYFMIVLFEMQKIDNKIIYRITNEFRGVHSFAIIRGGAHHDNR